MSSCGGGPQSGSGRQGRSRLPARCPCNHAAPAAVRPSAGATSALPPAPAIAPVTRGPYGGRGPTRARQPRRLHDRAGLLDRDRQPDRPGIHDPDHRRNDPVHRPPADPGLGRRPRADQLRPWPVQHRRRPQPGDLPGRGGRGAGVPRLPDRAAGRERELPRGRLPADLRAAAVRGRAGRLDRGHLDAHLRAREHQGLHAGLPLQRAPDGDAAGLGRRAVHLLLRTRTSSRIPAPSTCTSGG